MPENFTTRGEGAFKIWVYTPPGSQQLLALAERVSIHFGLPSDDEGVELLVRLLGGLCAACSDAPGCHNHLATHNALTVIFAAGRKWHGAFFDYVVNDLKIAQPYAGGKAEEGGGR